MPRFIKFIEKQFNPMRGCQTLRFGSIDRYRAYDASTGTGDPDEARHGFMFGPGLVIDTSKDYFYDSPLHTTGFIKVNPAVMRGSKNPALLYGSDSSPLGPASFVWPRENFFIYCLTVLDDNEEPTWEMARRVRPGANSAFEIRDIDEFVREVSALRDINVKAHHFDRKVIQNFINVGGNESDIRRVTAHGEVNYVDDLMTLVNTEEEFRKFSADWNSNMVRCAFRKLRKYECQKEYRIAFLFDHPIVGTLPAANCWLDLLFVELKSIRCEIPLKRSRRRGRFQKAASLSRGHRAPHHPDIPPDTFVRLPPPSPWRDATSEAMSDGPDAGGLRGGAI